MQDTVQGTRSSTDTARDMDEDIVLVYIWRVVDTNHQEPADRRRMDGRSKLRRLGVSVSQSPRKEEHEHEQSFEGTALASTEYYRVSTTAYGVQ